MAAAQEPGCCRRSCRHRSRAGEAGIAGGCFWGNAKYRYPLWLIVAGTGGHNRQTAGKLVAPGLANPVTGSLPGYRSKTPRRRRPHHRPGRPSRAMRPGRWYTVHILSWRAILSNGGHNLSDPSSRGRQLCRRSRPGRCAAANRHRLRDRVRGPGLDRPGPAAMGCRRSVPDTSQPEMARVLTASEERSRRKQRGNDAHRAAGRGARIAVFPA